MDQFPRARATGDKMGRASWSDRRGSSHVPEHNADLVVLGGGSGGYACALRAAELGMSVVLGTGSYSKTLPGLDIGGRIITSTEAIHLDDVPNRVVVLGGGVIGVEFASVFRSFGSEVTIVEALPRLVPSEDEFASKQLERAFRRRKIAFKTGVKFTGAKQDDKGVSV